MSNYQRWEPLDDRTMRQSPDGGWVLIGDYSCLKREAYILSNECKNLQSENARLKAEIERLIEERCFLNEKLNHFVKQTVQNREQVERLRKAGDDLITSLDKRDDVFDNSDKRNAINAWNAAKEGKPSA